MKHLKIRGTWLPHITADLLDIGQTTGVIHVEVVKISHNKYGFADEDDTHNLDYVFKSKDADVYLIADNNDYDLIRKSDNSIMVWLTSINTPPNSYVSEACWNRIKQAVKEYNEFYSTR